MLRARAERGVISCCFASALLACLAPVAKAGDVLSGKGAGYQNPAAGHHRYTIDDRVKRMGERLSLTDAQKIALKGILEREHVLGQKIWNDPSLSGAERIQAYRNVDRQTIQQIRDLLTEEQRTRYGLGPKEPPAVQFVPTDTLPGMK